MKITFSIIIFFLISLSSYGQKVSNVTFEPQQNNIVIYYDLEGEADAEYEVTVILKREAIPGYLFYPTNIKGDVGEGKFAGKKRTITWEVYKDYKIDEEVEDYYFEVTAEKVGGIGWYYYVGGAVLAGGAAALILMGGDETTTEQPIPIGPPPIRP